MPKWYFRLYVIFTILIVVGVLLSGCKSQPGVEPILTSEVIVTTPAKKTGRSCTKLENLPPCDGYYVIKYQNYITKCIWNARCTARF